VADKASGRRVPDDATLLNQVRTGDTSAFGVLYQRHFEAVRSLAREIVTSPAEADHLVAETFSLVHDVTQRGGGPTDAFRPYVLTALRRAAAGTLAEPAPGDPGTPIGSPESEGSAVTRAFMSLPERWRAVLWHSEIEQATPAEVAPILGVTPSGVAELGLRANEGLRQAVVRAHVARTGHPECAPTAEQLDAYQRGALAASAASAATAVAAHIGECPDCSAVSAALADLPGALRDQVAPAFLGPASAAYLAGIRQASPAGKVAGTAADTQEFTAPGAAAGSARLLYLLRHPRRRAWLGAIALLGAGAIIAVITLAGTSGPPASATNQRPIGADPPISMTRSASPAMPSRSGQPSPTARPVARARRRAAPTAPATSAAAPADSPSAASSAPAEQLTAAISIQGGGRRFVQLNFQVGNTGNAATGAVTATVTLPAGSWLIGAFGQRHGGGWTCQQESGGASCQHDPISAGTQAPGTLFIWAGGSACGQPVRISATSGTASASAQSAKNIRCGRTR
jgi:DNA-directed RNA polymerase specialized sigma24 family protein